MARRLRIALCLGLCLGGCTAPSIYLVADAATDLAPDLAPDLGPSDGAADDAPDHVDSVNIDDDARSVDVSDAGPSEPGCRPGCRADQRCVDGGCECPVGASLCGGLCRDLSTDVFHCGACDVGCRAASNAAPACVRGACALRCLEGFGNCDTGVGNGCERDLSNSHEHCGACGVACAATQQCVGGRCVACGPSAHWQWCGSGCVNVDPGLASGDPQNCGRCGAVCQRFCCRGSCQPVCI